MHDLVFQRLARHEQHGGRGAQRAADPVQHFEAAHARQQPVQDHEVERRGAQQPLRLLAVGRFDHLMTERLHYPRGAPSHERDHLRLSTHASAVILVIGGRAT